MAREKQLSFPSDPDKVCDEGILAQWSEKRGAYILSERIDEDTWASVGYVFTERDARRIVEGWVT